MRSRRALIAVAVVAALAGPVLPGAASTPSFETSVVRRALQPGAAAVADLREGDRIVGVTWERGAADVETRWRTTTGWTPWTAQEVEPGAVAGDDGDDGVRPGTEPLWRPAGATAVAVRVRGDDVARPQLLVVGERPVRRWTVGGAPAQAASSTGDERLGHVVSRRDWGADESLRKKPTYQARVDAVVVHHTVNANDYAQADVPAIIRAIYAFHVRGRGWDDIAYNLLVDRFGRIYEGRAGGFRSRAIKGSHTGGFNERTVGVAMIGDLDRALPEAPMVEGVARVASWAADRWGFDPRTDVRLVSKGSSRYPSGRAVTVPRVLGHRDLSSTACPGRHAYPLLPAWRDRAWRLLAPVITDVVVDGAPVRSPSTVRIRARLTAAASWSITVRSPYGGFVVTTSQGGGNAPYLEWDGRVGGVPATPGDYPWTTEADDGVHGPSDPVAGVVTVGLPLAPRARA
ncbi:MAG TPA: peptidoglycan recognition protein [Mycobacteriales bacterium]|nr:peptidoglycan recognition protein [Mycobacteriales bacterium]